MVIIGRILVFFGLAAILHAGYSAVQCKYASDGPVLGCNKILYRCAKYKKLNR